MNFGIERLERHHIQAENYDLWRLYESKNKKIYDKDEKVAYNSLLELETEVTESDELYN